MMMDVKIVAQGRDYTGVPVEQIRRAVAQGRITGNDMVRFAGAPSWTLISQIPEFAALIPKPAAQATPTRQQQSAPYPAATPSATTQAAPPQPALPRAAPQRPPAPASVAPSPTYPAARLPVSTPAAAPRSPAMTAAAPTSLNGDEFGIAEPAKSRRRRPRRKLEDSIMDMTPMIDVTFQLLIFFMFSNQLANPNPIEVPEAVYGQGITPEGKQALLVDDQGRYYFGESTDEKNIAPSLEALVAAVSDTASQQHQELEVIISAHKNAKHRHIRELVEELEKSPNIGLIRVGVEEKQ